MTYMLRIHSSVAAHRPDFLASCCGLRWKPLLIAINHALHKQYTIPLDSEGMERDLYRTITRPLFSPTGVARARLVQYGTDWYRIIQLVSLARPFSPLLLLLCYLHMRAIGQPNLVSVIRLAHIATSPGISISSLPWKLPNYGKTMANFGKTMANFGKLWQTCINYLKFAWVC